jgi:hypothetical protein
MSVVRPEFGPTLPELVGPHVRRLPAIVRAALLAVAVVVVALVIWLLVRPSPGRANVVVHGASATFNVSYAAPLHRVAARSGEDLRLQTHSGPPQSFVVRPLRLPAYSGDVTAELTFLSSSLVDDMRTQYARFVWRGDGRVNINKQPGYQIEFQAQVNGRTMYGKRVLIVATADPPPRAGVDFTVLSARTPAVPNVDAVAGNGPLKIAYRSFRFGASHP